MGNKLFVGNIAWAATKEEVQELFSQAGTVEDVYLVIDRERNRHKGYGFVTMSTDEEAQEAVDKFNDYELQGRNLKVDIARPREEGAEKPRRNKTMRPDFGGNRGQSDDDYGYSRAA